MTCDLASGDPVVIGEAIEGEGEDETAGAGRPAERALGLAHSFAGTDDPPKDIRHATADFGDG